MAAEDTSMHRNTGEVIVTQENCENETHKIRIVHVIDVTLEPLCRFECRPSSCL